MPIAGWFIYMLISDWRYNSEEASKLMKGLREMGLGSWIDRRSFTVHNQSFGDHMSAQRNADMVLEPKEIKPFIEAIEKAGFRYYPETPTTEPSDLPESLRSLQYGRQPGWWSIAIFPGTGKVLISGN